MVLQGQLKKQESASEVPLHTIHKIVQKNDAATISRAVTNSSGLRSRVAKKTAEHRTTAARVAPRASRVPATKRIFVLAIKYKKQAAKTKMSNENWSDNERMTPRILLLLFMASRLSSAPILAVGLLILGDISTVFDVITEPLFDEFHFRRRTADPATQKGPLRP